MPTFDNISFKKSIKKSLIKVVNNYFSKNLHSREVSLGTTKLFLSLERYQTTVNPETTKNAHKNNATKLLHYPTSLFLRA